MGRRLVSVLLMALLVPSLVSAAYWVSDPSNCPASDSTNFPGQDCSPTNICGDNSGIAQCYDTSAINPPSGSTTSETQYSSSFGGGYIIDCESSVDSSSPYCDNNGNAWCNRAADCYNVNRKTQCTGGSWVSYTCGSCRDGYTYCDGSYADADGCEVHIDVTDCSAGANNHINSSCGCECDSGWLDCDSSGAGSGNGCEVHDGGSCTVGGLPGTYSGCNCVISKSYFETGTETKYSTAAALLWGSQYGSGYLMNLTDGSVMKFGVNNSGCIVFADGSVQCSSSSASSGSATDLIWTNNSKYSYIKSGYPNWILVNETLNITNETIAIGYQANSSGLNSMSLGYKTKASGEGSTALGFMAIAEGYRSVALGYKSVADNPYDIYLSGDRLIVSPVSGTLNFVLSNLQSNANSLPVLVYNSTSDEVYYSSIASSGASGPSGAVQFNDNGAFGGSSDFFWNDSSKRLILTSGTTYNSTLRFKSGSNWADIFDSNDGTLNIHSSGYISLASKDGPFMITPTGVGVGTNNPSQKLQVEGGNLQINTGNIRLFRSDAKNLVVSFSGGNTKSEWSLGLDDSSLGHFIISQGTTLSAPNFVIAKTSGNIGIGTFVPSEKLELHDGNLRIEQGNIEIFRDDGDDPMISILGDQSGVYWTLGGDDSNKGDFIISQGTDLNSPVFFIQETSGRIGLGTTSPTQKLHVEGSGNFSGTVYASNFSSRSPLRLQTSGVTRIFVNDSNGYVGIGTTNPSDKLTLLGGNLTLDTGTIDGEEMIKFIDDNQIMGFLGFLQDIDTTGNPGIELDTNDLGFVISQNRVPRLIIDEDHGYLGLGTVLPSVRLDVNGTIKGSTDLKLGASSSGSYPEGMIYNDTLRRLELWNTGLGGQPASIYIFGDANNYVALDSEGTTSYTDLVGVTNRHEDRYDGAMVLAHDDQKNVYINDTLYVYDRINATNDVCLDAGKCLSNAVTGAAGSDKEIQFNNNGQLGASSEFTWDDSSKTFTVDSGSEYSTQFSLKAGSNEFEWYLSQAGTARLSSTGIFDFVSNGSNAMRLRNNQVAIGSHTTILGLLDVYGDREDLFAVRSSNASKSPRVALFSDAGNTVVNGNGIGQIYFKGYKSISYPTRYYGVGAAVESYASADWSSSSTPANLYFKTTSPSSTSPENRMAILNNGNVGIGTVTPGTRLDVNGSINVSSGNDVCITGGNCLSTAGSGSSGWTDDGTVVRLTTSADQVAIGQTNAHPSRTLTVGGTGSYAGSIFLNGTGPRVEFYASSLTSGNKAYDIVPYSDALHIRLLNDDFGTVNRGFMRLSLDEFEINENNANMNFKINGGTTEGLFFINASNEKIGIGTTSPTQKLHVEGSGNFSGTVYASNFSSRSPLRLQTSGVTRIFVNDSNGNVGIGTVTPGTRLDVNGSINVSSGNDICITGGNCLSSVSGGSSPAGPEGAIQFNNGGSFGGSKLFFNGSTSYVGIGTSAPATQFEIHKSGGGEALRITSYGTTMPTLTLGDDNSAPGAGYINLYRSGTSTVKITGEPSNPTYFNAGKIGIGTTNPSDKLTLLGGNLTLDTGTTDGEEMIKFIDDNQIMGFLGFLQDIDTTGNPGIELDTDDLGFVISQNRVPRLIIDEDHGYVGIGTVTPGTRLDVNGSINVSSGNDICITGGNCLSSVSGGSVSDQIHDSDSDTEITMENSADEDIIRFKTNGTQRMIINQKGYLGINTEDTSETVATFGKVYSTTNILQKTSDMAGVHVAVSSDDSEPSRFVLSKSRGSESSKTAVQNGDELGEVATLGYDGTQYISAGGMIIKTDGTVSTNHLPTQLIFLTTTDGNLGSSEKMYLDSEGNLGIGVADPKEKLEVAGDINVTTGHDICITGGNCLSSVSGGSTSPAGTDGAVQFNNGGSFGGNTNWIYINTTSGYVGLDTNTPKVGFSLGDSPTYLSGRDDAFIRGSLEIDGNIYNPGWRIEKPTASGVLLREAPNGYVVVGYDDDKGYYEFANEAVVALVTNKYVGIGTTSPQSLLHLKSSNPELRVEGNTDQTEKLSFYDDSTEKASLSMNNADGYLRLYSHSEPIQFQSGASQGLGTEEVFNFNATSDLGSTDEALQVSDGGGPLFTIKGDGKIGLGTTNPSDKLTLIGGNLTLDTGTTDGEVMIKFIDDNEIMGFLGFLQDIDGAGRSGIELGIHSAGFAISQDQIPRLVIHENTGYVGIGTVNPSVTLDVNGSLRVAQLAAATATDLCIDTNNQLASCSSSLRYKENITNLDLGLAAVEQLRPVTFKWKGRDERDIGFIAEEVAKIDPILATYNDHGQIEGVKYKQLTAVLANAIKEQQQEIDQQDRRIGQLESENVAMKRSLCKLGATEWC